MTTTVSFIVCTYNGSNFLSIVLDSLLEQKGFNTNFHEIIVVDNKSDKDHAFLIKQIVDSKRTVKLVYENEPGLNNARKNGVLNSSGDIIIFVDDDNILDPKFLMTATSLINVNQNVGAFCGYNIPVVLDETKELPIWFKQDERIFACGKLTDKSKLITWSIGEVWGAGMVIRRSLIEPLFRIDWKFMTSDRTKSNLSSGGDSEISYWVVLLGYDLYWSEDLKLKHLLNEDRLTLDYLKKIKTAMKQSGEILKVYKKHLSSIRRIQQSEDSNIQILKSFVKHLISQPKELLYIYKLNNYFISKIFLSDIDYTIWKFRNKLLNNSVI